MDRGAWWATVRGVTELETTKQVEGLMLRLKLQYSGHLMRRVDSLEETDAGRDCGQEEKGDDRG